MTTNYSLLCTTSRVLPLPSLSAHLLHKPSNETHFRGCGSKRMLIIQCPSPTPTGQRFTNANFHLSTSPPYHLWACNFCFAPPKWLQSKSWGFFFSGFFTCATIHSQWVQTTQGGCSGGSAWYLICPAAAITQLGNILLVQTALHPVRAHTKITITWSRCKTTLTTTNTAQGACKC